MGATHPPRGFFIYSLLFIYLYPPAPACRVPPGCGALFAICCSLSCCLLSTVYWDWYLVDYVSCPGPGKIHFTLAWRGFLVSCGVTLRTLFRPFFHAFFEHPLGDHVGAIGCHSGPCWLPFYLHFGCSGPQK